MRDDRWLILWTLLPGTAVAYLEGTFAALCYGGGIVAGALLVIFALTNLGQQHPDAVADLLHRSWSEERDSPDPQDWWRW